MLKNRSINRAFTLIELLVVVAIIGILTSIVLASLNSAKVKSRDAKRISDISQIQLALEQFFDRCQEYPIAIIISDDAQYACSYDSSIKLKNYISKIPTDPTNSGSYTYKYAYRTSDKLDYVLQAKFEKDNEALRDSLGSFPASGYSPTFTCNIASPSFEYCIGPK